MKPNPLLPTLHVLSVLCAVFMLTGCPPGGKLPDPPPTVPQPKTMVLVDHASLEI